VRLDTNIPHWHGQPLVEKELYNQQEKMMGMGGDDEDSVSMI
jgi:hypothetical protein